MRASTLAGLAAFLGFPALAPAQNATKEPAHHPLIFQYVSPFREGDNEFSSVMALCPEQMTVDEGENPLFDGVTLIIPWSILEPKPGQVDFSILDAPLAYWGAKGKQIVLNVAPVTFPTVLGKAWGGKLTGGTPDWVMRNCETHVVTTRLLGPRKEQEGPFPLPCPWDPHFEQAYFDFIAQLGKKYDGDPRIAAVRIGTGMEGEEQYLVPGIGFTNRKWYGYVAATMQAYVAAFHQSQLECDLAWSGVAYHGVPSTARLAEFGATENARPFVENVISLLKQAHIVFGNNGWRSFDPKKSTWTSIDQLIRQFHDDGYPVALEVGGALQNKRMWDTASLFASCARIAPVRVNFMGNTAAIINYAEGIDDPRDRTSLDLYQRSVAGQGADPLAMAKKFRDLVVAVRHIDLDAPTPH